MKTIIFLWVLFLSVNIVNVFLVSACLSQTTIPVPSDASGYYKSNSCSKAQAVMKCSTLHSDIYQTETLALNI